MTRINSRDKNLKNAFTEINIVQIIISLKGLGTESVTLTMKCFASAVAQDHVLPSEEFWLNLMSNR